MINTEPNRLCRTCNSVLPLSQFYKTNLARCIPCMREKAKIYRDALDAKSERVCGKCKVLKLSDQFYSGCGYCKECQNLKTNGNRDRKAERDRQNIPRKCSRCKEIKTGIEAFGTCGASYCLKCSSVTTKKLKYKLTHDEVLKTELIEACDICRQAFKSRRDRHIDHCHRSGKVRGILCSNCNTALGQMRDSVEILESAIAYLNRNNKQSLSWH